MFYPQRQRYRAFCAVAFLGSEDDLVRFDRVFQVAVRFVVIEDAVDEMVHLALKRMVAHIRTVGADIWKFLPVFLRR